MNPLITIHTIVLNHESNTRHWKRKPNFLCIECFTWTAKWQFFYVPRPRPSELIRLLEMHSGWVPKEITVLVGLGSSICSGSIWVEFWFIWCNLSRAKVAALPNWALVFLSGNKPEIHLLQIQPKKKKEEGEREREVSNQSGQSSCVKTKVIVLEEEERVKIGQNQCSSTSLIHY